MKKIGNQTKKNQDNPYKQSLLCLGVPVCAKSAKFIFSNNFYPKLAISPDFDEKNVWCTEPITDLLIVHGRQLARIFKTKEIQVLLHHVYRHVYLGSTHDH